MQQYFHDFFNYAGLHRSVWLHATPRTHVGRRHRHHDGHRRHDVGVVAYRAVVEGDEQHDVRATVRDAGGAEVARADGTEGTVRIEGVRCGARAPATCTPSKSRSSAGEETSSTLSAAVRCPDGRRGRPALPDQRRAVPLHRLRQARGRRDPRPRLRPGRDGPRLRVARVDRRELVPHVALPLRRELPGLRRPPRRRRHRRDGRRRAQPRHRHAHPRRAEATDDLQRRDHQRRGPRRPTARRSASSSRATRTTRAWSIWSIANEPDTVPPEARAYFEPLVAETRRLDPTRPGRVRQLHEGHARPRRRSPTSSTCCCSTATSAGTCTRATSCRPSGRSRPSCASGRSAASRSS